MWNDVFNPLASCFLGQLRFAFRATVMHSNTFVSCSGCRCIRRLNLVLFATSSMFFLLLVCVPCLADDGGSARRNPRGVSPSAMNFVSAFRGALAAGELYEPFDFVATYESTKEYEDDVDQHETWRIRHARFPELEKARFVIEVNRDFLGKSPNLTRMSAINIDGNSVSKVNSVTSTTGERASFAKALEMIDLAHPKYWGMNFFTYEIVPERDAGIIVDRAFSSRTSVRETVGGDEVGYTLVEQLDANRVDTWRYSFALPQYNWKTLRLDRDWSGNRRNTFEQTIMWSDSDVPRPTRVIGSIRQQRRIEGVEELLIGRRYVDVQIAWLKEDDSVFQSSLSDLQQARKWLDEGFEKAKGQQVGE